MTTRWMKIVRDVRVARGRLAMVVGALAVSVSAVVTMLSAYTVLGREVPRSYQSSNPASAQLELQDSVSSAALTRALRQPNVAAAERAGVIGVRVDVGGGEWLPLRLFVVPDSGAARINAVHPESGSPVAAPGTLLVERSAMELLHATVGAPITIDIAGVGHRTLRVGGSVHDPGVAPAWQEQTGYGYVTRGTLAALGVQVPLDLLKIVVRDGATDADSIATTVQSLSRELAAVGVTVHEARIPPPGRHPHQSQMNAIITMLLAFSLLVMLLGAILTAGAFNAMLTQQAPQIAIMKTIGARRSQIIGLYLALVVVLGALATVLGLILGLVMGRQLVDVVAQLLNLRLVSTTPPWWVAAVTVTMGLATPVLAALVPIRLAARRTVRDALDDRGGATRPGDANALVRVLSGVRVRDAALTLAIRNTVRRRARLMMTVAMLAGAGAMFIASLDLKAAWERNVATAGADRHFQFEVWLDQRQPDERVTSVLMAVPGVTRTEAWDAVSATRGGDEGLEISRTYPDGGHGGVTLRSTPAGTALIAHQMIAGRWLAPGDSDGVVINTMASMTVFRDRHVGDTTTIRVDHRAVTVRLVGIMREPLTGSTVFLTPAQFRRVSARAATTNNVRVQVADGARGADVSHALQQSLERAGVGVRLVLTSARMASAQGGHVYILVFALGFIATLMAIVGLIGLASSLGVSVLERTREFGIMRALGGTRALILRTVMAEGVVIAVASVLVAVVLSRPLSMIVGRVLASIANQELLLRLSMSGVLTWVLGLLVGTLLVSYVPAARAGRLTARDALAHT